MYKPEHFKTQEWVPPGIYKLRGEKSLEVLNPLILITADRLRKRYGPITINNWLWGGARKYSGFRPKHCSEGASLSQHRLGNALDGLVQRVSAEEVRQDILGNPDLEEFEYITSLEMGVNWLHVDCRNCKRIKLFYP